MRETGGSPGIHEGGCLCRAVRYRVEGEPGPVEACHCSQCRRWSGHFIAATRARRTDVAITGEIRRYGSAPGEVRHGFCPVCGSSLFRDRYDEDGIDIRAGSLAPPTGLTLACHIFVADRRDCCDIADGLPQHPAGEGE